MRGGLKVDPAGFRNRRERGPRGTRAGSTLLRPSGRAGHFCLPLHVCHPCRSDCLTISGRAPAMPPGVRVHDRDPAHTVSTRQRASLTLGIPQDWRGSPNSAVFHGGSLRRATSPDGVAEGRVDHRPRTSCYSPRHHGGPPGFPAALHLFHRCRSDCLTISGHTRIMPSGYFHDRDPAHTVSALRRASPQLMISRIIAVGFHEQCRFPRQVTLPRRC